jgi:hypothetical protein
VDPRSGDALRGPGADERRTRGLAADTRVGFAWTPEGLIVRAALRDRDLAPLAGGRDTELWKGDALEVFLAHADREAYVELQTAATGELFDARFIARRQARAAPDAGVAWDGHTRVGVRLDGTLARGDEDRGWDVELLVPWSDLRGVGVIDDVAAAGVRLRANVFRVERDADGRMSAASLAPTRESDFHAMGEAPTLVLAGGAGS